MSKVYSRFVADVELPPSPSDLEKEIRDWEKEKEREILNGGR